MSDTASKPSNTLGEAMRDLGWFSVLFAVGVGGPSVLALLQSAIVDHKLTDALQWIVDGYHGIAEIVGAAFEPLLHPLVAWVGRLLGWSIELHDHWRPLFVLCMVLVTSFGRALWRHDQKWRAAVFFLTSSIGALAGSAVAGMFPVQGNWWMQGLAAGMPIALVMTSTGLFIATEDLLTRSGNALDTIGIFLSVAVGAAVIAFILGALLSLVPVLASGAGILAIAIVIIAMGLICVVGGGDSVAFSSAGLTTLGGFITAGIILTVDAILKAAA